jgi:hypothetical protein
VPGAAVEAAVAEGGTLLGASVGAALATVELVAAGAVVARPLGAVGDTVVLAGEAAAGAPAEVQATAARAATARAATNRVREIDGRPMT